MDVEIVLIGDELLDGSLREERNGRFLTDRLTAAGHRVTRTHTLPDQPEVIGRVAREAVERAVVIACGGLGPTEDDLTRDALASAFGRDLALDPGSVDRLKEIFERRGIDFPEVSIRQAFFPEGAVVLENPSGTAPAFLLMSGSHPLYALPGVPSEVEDLWERHLERAFPPDRPIHRRRYALFGVTESRIQARVEDLRPAGSGVRLAFRPRFPENLLELSGPEEMKAEVDRFAYAIREAFDRQIYAEEHISLPAAIGRLLHTSGQTLAVAESCTGGLTGALLTDAAGSSTWFLGGVIAYSNQAKQRLLGIPAVLLDRHGAVSEQVAVAMAERAREIFGTTFGIGLTGIAGPAGGTPDKPVGTVHCAVAFPGGAAHEQHRFDGQRRRIRRLAAHTVLDMLRQLQATRSV